MYFTGNIRTKYPPYMLIPASNIRQYCTMFVSVIRCFARKSLLATVAGRLNSEHHVEALAGAVTVGLAEGRVSQLCLPTIGVK